MGKIFAVANQKGGVGKSTTVVNLAAYLGSRDYTVLCIDIDAQGNTTTGFGIKKKSIEYSTYDILIGQARIQDAVRRTEFKNVSIVPATSALAGGEVEMISIDDRMNRLKMQLLTCRLDYDYIIIDCPPSLSLMTINSLVACDKIIVPMQAEFYALEGLSQLMETIRIIKNKYNPMLAGTTCRNSCGNSCSGNCGNSCSGGCGGNCSGKCQSACSGGCYAVCSKDCVKSCSGGCGKSGCSGGCYSCDGCAGGCKSKCTTGCVGCKGCSGCSGCTGCTSCTGCSGCSGCSTGCVSGCTGCTGCNNGCKSCTSCTGCVSSCSSNCSSACTGGCLTSCSGSCAVECTSQCFGTCAASTTAVAYGRGSTL